MGLSTQEVPSCSSCDVADAWTQQEWESRAEYPQYLPSTAKMVVEVFAAGTMANKNVMNNSKIEKTREGKQWFRQLLGEKPEWR